MLELILHIWLMREVNIFCFWIRTWTAGKCWDIKRKLICETSFNKGEAKWKQISHPVFLLLLGSHSLTHNDDNGAPAAQDQPDSDWDEPAVSAHCECLFGGPTCLLADLQGLWLGMRCTCPSITVYWWKSSADPFLTWMVLFRIRPFSLARMSQGQKRHHKDVVISMLVERAVLLQLVSVHLLHRNISMRKVWDR